MLADDLLYPRQAHLIARLKADSWRWSSTVITSLSGADSHA